MVGAAAVLVPIQQAPPALPPVAPDTAIVFGLSSVTLPLPLAARAARVPEPQPVSDAASVRPPSNFAEALSPEVAALPGVESAIINVYNAVEPWVEWGFDVAQYAVGWVPIAGYFAPQIGIFYDFFESIVQSVVFNFAYWIGGDVTFFEGLGNIAQDSWNALVQLGVDELNWILPPLPPWPPIFNAAVEAAPEASTPGDDAVRTGTVAVEQVDRPTVADVPVEDGPEEPSDPAEASEQSEEPAETVREEPVLDDEQAAEVTAVEAEPQIEIEAEPEIEIDAEPEVETETEPEIDTATETAAPDDADADASAEGAGDAGSE
ncbi:hypothetical protein MDUV_29540 [Mycolicibacterium duvalii]|uniref:PE family protein n=1 Tax=Mycolicibacterium duvalii TaxID=39688 RepID=A0A7I7K3D0_9MYCO|nr:hypothetical protein MDUV_29540 [Mycolicibacterium duvalii]